LRLKRTFRRSIYAAFAVLFLTGTVWLVADWQKDISPDEIWQQLAATMLMVHGGAAMITLLLLGALIPIHLLRSWRAAKNRISGSVMVAFNAVLIVTAFGLYYLGSEAVRPWMSKPNVFDYCSGGSPLVRFLARSISVTAIKISARVFRSGASSIACFSAGP
jgi:cytochrome c biogenesis protein CcdA